MLQTSPRSPGRPRGRRSGCPRRGTPGRAGDRRESRRGPAKSPCAAVGATAGEPVRPCFAVSAWTSAGQASPAASAATSHSHRLGERERCVIATVPQVRRGALALRVGPATSPSGSVVARIPGGPARWDDRAVRWPPVAAWTCAALAVAAFVAALVLRAIDDEPACHRRSPPSASPPSRSPRWWPAWRSRASALRMRWGRSWRPGPDTGARRGLRRLGRRRSRWPRRRRRVGRAPLRQRLDPGLRAARAAAVALPRWPAAGAPLALGRVAGHRRPGAGGPGRGVPRRAVRSSLRGRRPPAARAPGRRGRRPHRRRR